MNAANTHVSISGKTKPAHKRKNRKPKRYVLVKFNKEGFFISLGIGILTSGIGLLIIWATITAPKNTTDTMAYSVSQRITQLLPESAKELIGFILGNLFLLFGVFCIFLGLRMVVQFIAGRLKN